MILTDKAKIEFLKWFYKKFHYVGLMDIEEMPDLFQNSLIIEWFSTLQYEGKNFYNKVFDFYYQQRLDIMTINDIHKQAIEKANNIFNNI